MDSRTSLLILSVAFSLAFPAHAGVIFSQDFSSVPNGHASDYVGHPPNATQWDAISWRDGTTGGIKDGVLWYNRNGAGAGWFARINNFAPTPNAMIYSFSLEVTGNSVAMNSAATCFEPASWIARTSPRSSLIVASWRSQRTPTLPSS